jgi:hypothetical protein
MAKGGSMKTNCRYEVVSRIAERSLLFVGLLAIALVCTGSGHAQSTPVAAGGSKTPAAAAPPGAPAAHSPGNAMRSGVKVHGYWKIDVRNPDGKLASHNEFENSLTTNDPNGLSGDDALALLLSGGPSSITFTNGTVSTTGSLASLVAAFNAALQSKPPDVVESVAVSFPYLVIGVNANGFNYVAGQASQAINYVLPGPCGSSPCETTTSQSVNGNAISLSTTFGATAQSTINEVGTFVSLAVLKYKGKGGAYIFETPGITGANANYTFTSVNLGAPGSCGGPGQPPCQVPVSPGQTVAVSVAISFN